MIDDQDKHCKKSCSVKEFRVEKSLESSFHEGLSRLTVSIQFGLPESTRGFISKTLFKTVKTEQYVISGLQLLGNVGGILGIFIGFSFQGITEPILSISERLCKFVRKIF